MTDFREPTPQEKWDNATIANNFIFYKIMRNNPDVCQEFIERLLQIEIDHIEMAQEEEFNIDIDSKAIRMDVYAKNEQFAFDLEMQAIDTKELPERARYYQGVIDVDNLKSGQVYSKLKTSYIIFICINDIFNYGLAEYHFENLEVKNPEIRMNDRTHKYFFVSNNYDKMEDVKKREILQLVKENKSSSDFSKRILKLVEIAKTNTQWRIKFMEYERQRAYDLLTGEQKGRAEAKLEDAVIAVKKFNISPETVAKEYNIPLEELQKALGNS